MGDEGSGDLREGQARGADRGAHAAHGKPEQVDLIEAMALMNVIASLVICSIDAAGEPLDAQTPRLSKVTP